MLFIYFNQSIIETIYTAQLLAKEWGLEVDGVKLTKEPKKPELTWADGLPIDNSEAIENETDLKDGELTTTKDSLMRLYNLTDKQAEEKAKEIKDQNAIDLPKMNTGGDPFNPKNPNPKVPPKK